VARLRRPKPEPEPEPKVKPSERYADLKVYPGGLAHDDPRMARTPTSVPIPQDDD
jgi:hypothetical protein